MQWINTLIKREHVNSPSLMQTYVIHVAVKQKMPSAPKNTYNDDNYHVKQYKWTTNSPSSEGKVVKLSLEVIIGSWVVFWISNYSTSSNKLTSNISNCRAVIPTEVAKHTFPASKADVYTYLGCFEIRNQDRNPEIMAVPILIFCERKVGDKCPDWVINDAPMDSEDSITHSSDPVICPGKAHLFKTTVHDVSDNNSTGRSLFPRHTDVNKRNTCERCSFSHLQTCQSCFCHITQSLDQVDYTINIISCKYGDTHTEKSRKIWENKLTWTTKSCALHPSHWIQFN